MRAIKQHFVYVRFNGWSPIGLMVALEHEPALWHTKASSKAVSASGQVSLPMTTMGDERGEFFKIDTPLQHVTACAHPC